MIGTLIFEDNLALRAAIGSILAILAAIGYGQIAPYSSSSVNLLSTSAMWLVSHSVVSQTSAFLIGHFSVV